MNKTSTKGEIRIKTCKWTEKSMNKTTTDGQISINTIR
jgi:hypothetical protein